uniref:Uncharacterized protein n=1 Tax=Piliocolobus tephrosceles TaxID=591936 RepID=A0A8C9HIY2_9PRIM
MLHLSTSAQFLSSCRATYSRVSGSKTWTCLEAIILLATSLYLALLPLPFSENKQYRRQKRFLETKACSNIYVTLGPFSSLGTAPLLLSLPDLWMSRRASIPTILQISKSKTLKILVQLETVVQLEFLKHTCLYQVVFSSTQCL